MKKITLAVLAMCLALPVFAVDMEGATFTVSGNASVTFGVDLESNATGFTNGAAADFVLAFTVPTTALSSGMDMGDVYGEIAFKDIRAEIEENDIVDANIALNYAKIMGENWWLSVVGPDATVDYENALQNGIIGVAAAWDGQMDNVNNTVASSGGFEVGLTIPDVAAIEVSLFSMTDWTATTDINAYGMKASAAIKAVAGLTLEAAANLGFGTDVGSTLNDAVGIGGKVAYAITAGDITITPEVAVDMVLLDAGADIAIGNGVRIALPGSEITAAEDAVKDDAGTSLAWDDGVNSGLTLGWSYYMPSVGDASLGLQAHYGLSSIENLQVAVGFEVDDLMGATNTMGMALYGKYVAGDFTPWAGFFMVFDGQMVANAGLNWAMLPKTTLALEWRSGDLSLTDPDLGIVKATVKITY
jgi:hypothetical protein